MPRPKKVPSYCLHKATGQAYVTVDGRERYLGKHGSPESQEKYARVIAERFSNPSSEPVIEASFDELTVTELIAKYWKEFVEVPHERRKAD